MYVIPYLTKSVWYRSLNNVNIMPRSYQLTNLVYTMITFRQSYLTIKILNSLRRIRDGTNSDLRSGINIPDPQTLLAWLKISAKLCICVLVFRHWAWTSCRRSIGPWQSPPISPFSSSPLSCSSIPAWAVTPPSAHSGPTVGKRGRGCTVSKKERCWRVPYLLSMKFHWVKWIHGRKKRPRTPKNLSDLYYVPEGLGW